MPEAAVLVGEPPGLGAMADELDVLIVISGTRGGCHLSLIVCKQAWVE